MSEQWVDTNKNALLSGQCQAAIAVGKALGICHKPITHKATNKWGTVHHVCEQHCRILTRLPWWSAKSLKELKDVN